jgi:hypothetical protein
MLNSPTRLASTTDLVDKPMPRPQSDAPSIEAPSTEVLLTTQEVAFSTAAAVGVQRENIVRRFVAIMRRVFAASTDASRPRPRYEPKRYAYLENALMAREMERL